MTDARNSGSGFDLDAAFAALAHDERAARPVPSGDLIGRVLADAARVAAELAEARRAAAAAPLRRRAGGASAGAVSGGAVSGGGWLRLFGFGDAWAGATVALVALVLGIGLLAGYQAGPQMLDMTGLDGSGTQLADAGDDWFAPEEGAL